MSSVTTGNKEPTQLEKLAFAAEMDLVTNQDAQGLLAQVESVKTEVQTLGVQVTEAKEISAEQAALAVAARVASQEALLAAQQAAQQVIDIVEEGGLIGPPGTNNATVFLFQRTASVDVVPSPPSATLTYNFGTASLTGNTEGWEPTVPLDQEGPCLYATTCVAAAPTPTVAVTPDKWNSARLMSVDGLPGSSGAPGISNSIVHIYQRSVTQPALPGGPVTFTFSTGAVTGLNNGWTPSVPAGMAPLWVSVATASSVGQSFDTIAQDEWATPVILAQNGTSGADGASGANTASIFLYRRNASGVAPAVPSTDLTYTFATAALTGTLDGWSQTVPAESGGSYLFVTTATALSTGATDTIASSEWSAVRIMAQGAVAATLSNEAAVFPADSLGNVISYAGNTTTMTVTVGGQNDTPNWTFSRVNGTNVTSTLVGNTLTLDSITAGQDASYVDITATRAGFNSLTKRFSVSKAKQGNTGSTGAPGSNGSAGAPGARGNVQLSRNIAGTAWSDTEAIAALNAAGFATPVFQDRVTLVGPAVTSPAVRFVQTRYWSGSAWLVATVQLDGNLFVEGSIAAQALSVNSIETKHLKVGSVSIQSGSSRMNTAINPGNATGLYDHVEDLATITSSGGYFDILVRYRPSLGLNGPSAYPEAHIYQYGVLQLINNSTAAVISLDADQGGSHELVAASGGARVSYFHKYLFAGVVVPPGTYTLRLTVSFAVNTSAAYYATGVMNTKYTYSEQYV